MPPARLAKPSRLLALLGLAILLLTQGAQAQSPPGLRLQVTKGSASLSITGLVGSACEIQFVSIVARSNVWLWLTNVTMSANPQSVADATSAVTGRRFYRAAWVPTNVVLVPAGSFTMGDTLGDAAANGWTWELPTHTLYVSAFYVDQNLVTSNQWYAVKSWSSGNGYSYDNAGQGKAGNHPVQFLDWFDTVKWCNARSQKEGLTPCYYADAGLTVVYKSGQVAPYVNWAANGYRLPTEAEWEKAARGGASGHRFPWSDVDTITQSRANYISEGVGNPDYPYDVNPTSGYAPAFDDGVFPYTSPVGSFAANGYGLYDMAGNVFQWCWDWYDGTFYSSSPGTDPHGPASSPGGTRVLRGGAWNFEAGFARCAYRYGFFQPVVSSSSVCFRCVRKA